jgi:hypothetical protein
MNKKVSILLILIFIIFSIALVGMLGSAPYNEEPTLAKVLKWDVEKNESGKKIIYLPKLETDGQARLNLAELIIWDENATFGKESLKYSLFVHEKDLEKVILIKEGALAGWISFFAQVNATVIVSSTDGSGLKDIIYIKNDPANIIIEPDIIDGDIFD